MQVIVQENGRQREQAREELKALLKRSGQAGVYIVQYRPPLWWRVLVLTLAGIDAAPWTAMDIGESSDLVRRILHDYMPETRTFFGLDKRQPDKFGTCEELAKMGFDVAIT